MYPSKHQDVLSLLEEANLSFGFFEVDDSGDSVNEYDTNIMGRFVCHESACTSEGWSSKRVPITIREYPDKKYNARVYRQRCKSCNKLGELILDDSYAERVAYRLKRWSGIYVTPPYFSTQSKGPHQKDLCEGCRNRHCIESVQDEES